MSFSQDEKPVRQFIICGCDEKFLNEADLKSHLNVVHQGESEVKVRIQKVYYRNDPKVKVEAIPGLPLTSGYSPKQYKSLPKQCISPPRQINIPNTDIVSDHGMKLSKESLNERVSKMNENLSSQYCTEKLENVRAKVENTSLPGKVVSKNAKPIVIPRHAIQKSTDLLQLNANLLLGHVALMPMPNFKKNIVDNSLPAKPIVPNLLKPIVIPKSKIITLDNNFVLKEQPGPNFVAVRKDVSTMVEHKNFPTVQENAQNSTTRLPPPHTAVKKLPAVKVLQQANTHSVGPSTLASKQLGADNNIPVSLNIRKTKPVLTKGQIVLKNTSTHKYPKLTPLYVLHSIHTEPKFENDITINQVHEQTSGENQYIIPKVKLETVDNNTNYETEIQDASSIEQIQGITVEEGNEEAIEDSDEVPLENCKVEMEEDGDEVKSDGDEKFEMTVSKIKIVDEGEGEKEYFYCDVCGKTLDTLRALRYHRSRFHKVKSEALRDPTIQYVKCDLCPKEYKSETSLKMHLTKSHSLKNGDKSELSCKVCGKDFKHNFLLVCHMRKHTGEKPFQCGECFKTYKTKSFLKEHHRTHTGEKPYECKDCDKRFIGQAALWRHRKVHTGERPYTCAECGKGFTQSNSMKLHVLTVHLKQPAPYKSQKRVNRPSTSKRDRLQAARVIPSQGKLKLESLEEVQYSQELVECTPEVVEYEEVHDDCFEDESDEVVETVDF